MHILNSIENLKISENVNLVKYNTYKVNSIAKAMAFPKDIKELIQVLKLLKQNNIKYMILGNGSNVIFNSHGYNGVIIKLDSFNKLIINGTSITVGAGYSLIKLASEMCELGYTGLEFATGIPGTLGGSVYMNAGAYKSDMGSIVSKIKVLTPEYKIKTLYNTDLNFQYRSSFLQHNKNYICLEVTIILKKGNKNEILQVVSERKKRRLMTQPLNMPSAGSVFRNPEGQFAGQLIEEIGYKGKSIGGAQVSEKHANFIVNTGVATGEEIKCLIKDVQNKVKEKYNIELKFEQEFIE